MNNIQELVLYGSDKRQTALKECFENTGVTVHLPESENSTEICCCHTKKQPTTILLPVPCSEAMLHTIWEHTASGSTIIGGNLPKWFQEQCHKKHIAFYDYMTSSSVAILNGVSTAEGAILEAIAASPWTLFSNACLIMGFGRCGSILAHRLLALGATVCVSARSQEKTAKATALGCSLLHKNTDLSSFRFVFNTVPAMVLDASLLSQFAKDVVIIDIASAPGGCDFAYCEKHHIHASLYPGLPAKYSPKSAAQIIFQHLNEIYKIG